MFQTWQNGNKLLTKRYFFSYLNVIHYILLLLTHCISEFIVCLQKNYRYQDPVCGFVSVPPASKIFKLVFIKREIFF